MLTTPTWITSKVSCSEAKGREVSCITRRQTHTSVLDIHWNRGCQQLPRNVTRKGSAKRQRPECNKGHFKGWLMYLDSPRLQDTVLRLWCLPWFRPPLEISRGREKRTLLGWRIILVEDVFPSPSHQIKEGNGLYCVDNRQFTHQTQHLSWNQSLQRKNRWLYYCGQNSRVNNIWPWSYVWCLNCLLMKLGGGGFIGVWKISAVYRFCWIELKGWQLSGEN